MGLPTYRTAVRVGLPVPSGQLVEAAKAARYPVLFSANAFMVRNEHGETVRVRKPKPGSLDGTDAALDSAGFVAADRYRGYPWSVDQYLDLVESHPWTWYSSMDYCVEPEFAGSLIETMFRIAETCRMFGEVSRTAEARGLPPPVPVLQGWGTDHYLWCLDHMPLVRWPSFVGVGSMCRRHLHGPHGILAIVDALDRVLPPHVRLHLFGVKGEALAYLGGHPRIESVDSMAWDMAARRAHPTGRTADKRIAHMHGWADKAQSLEDSPMRPFARSLLSEDPIQVSEELEELLDMVASNEIDGGARYAAHLWMQE